MVASAKSFAISLYEEHLEEASVLFEQIRAYRHDPALAWTDLADWEERFGRHVDALVVGGELAVDVCARRLADGDAGERHAALCVLCRQRRKDLVYRALRDLDAEDAEAAAAFADALKLECPDDWREELAGIVARHPQLAPVLAVVAGHRRARWEPQLQGALPAASERGSIAVLWALGRVGGAASAAVVEPLAMSARASVAAEACRAALRLGSAETAGRALTAVSERPWLALALALGGGRSAVGALVEIARSDRVSDDVLIGLGLLGDLSAVRAVFDCLALPERAAAAATALQLITGAELYEEVFVPDDADPDALFEEERARYAATGELPKRADGTPFGIATVQLATDRGAWQEWLSRNKGRFDPRRRYRYGELYSPRALLASLLGERVPNRIRVHVCDEYRVRYGVDFPLEIDMPVVEQRRLLSRLEEWVGANESKYSPGEWYFHGRPVA